MPLHFMGNAEDDVNKFFSIFENIAARGVNESEKA